MSRAPPPVLPIDANCLSALDASGILMSGTAPGPPHSPFAAHSFHLALDASRITASPPSPPRQAGDEVDAGCEAEDPGGEASGEAQARGEVEPVDMRQVEARGDEEASRAGEAKADEEASRAGEAKAEAGLEVEAAECEAEASSEPEAEAGKCESGAAEAQRSVEAEAEADDGAARCEAEASCEAQAKAGESVSEHSVEAEEDDADADASGEAEASHEAEPEAQASESEPEASGGEADADADASCESQAGGESGMDTGEDEAGVAPGMGPSEQAEGGKGWISWIFGRG